MVTSSGITSSSKLSKNSSGCTLKMFQSHLLNPSKVVKAGDKQWMPKKVHKKQ
jgi:hypothetical protein